MGRNATIKALLAKQSRPRWYVRLWRWFGFSPVTATLEEIEEK
jgi:hypothetical protein